MDLSNLTITQAGRLLKSKRLSATELAEYYLQRIDTTDQSTRAYLEVFDDVREQARAAQRLLDNDQAGELTGLPLAVKDNILIRGRLVSAGSKMLANYRAVYSATVIDRLKEKGAVFLGRSNMDEFAMGSSTENSAWQLTRNPRDHERVPGGSSGGSAAAVAADLAAAALGSDTGGSIRQPAALCGCVGLKPTYGAVSRYGLMAMGSSLDQIGPITRTVEDAEILFRAIQGQDSRDSTTRPSHRSDTEDRPVQSSYTIGVPWSLVRAEGVSRTVIDSFSRTITELERLGHRVEEVELPGLKQALAAYYILMPAEVSSNMARFDGMRFGERVEGSDLLTEYRQSRARLGQEIRIRSLVGAFVLSAGYQDAYYYRAQAVKKQIQNDMQRAFNGDGNQTAVDMIATPTSPTAAFKIGEKRDDPIEMYMSDIFTVGANIAGIPALTVPAEAVAVESSKLPIGFQLMAPWRREDCLFALAKQLPNLNTE